MMSRPDASPAALGSSWYKSALKILNCTRFSSTDTIESTSTSAHFNNCKWAQVYGNANELAFCSSVYDSCTFSVLGIDNIAAGQNPTYSTLCQINVDSPASCASFFETVAALGLDDGLVSVYSVRDSAGKWIFDSKKRTDFLCTKALSTIRRDSFRATCNPSECANFRISSLCLGLDLGKSELLSSFENVQFIWNLQVPETPLNGFLFESLILTCKWNPQYPCIFAAGSLKGYVHICDSRAQDEAMALWNPHIGPIRTVSWNPLVSEWIAAAGDDGIVYVWDLRNSKRPMRELHSHINYVNCVSWSPKNADFLVSGSSDNTTQIWNIRIKPHFALPPLPKSDSSVVSVGWLNLMDKFSILSVSETGTIYLNTIDRKYLGNLAPGIDQNEEMNIQKVRKAIYSRDFSFGFNKTYLLAQDFLKQGKVSKTRKVLDICCCRYSTEPMLDVSRQLFNAAAIANLPAIEESEFDRMLDLCSSFIPQSYPDHLWPNVEEEVVRGIETLRVMVIIEQAIGERNGGDLIALSGNLVGILKENPLFIKSDVMLGIFETLIPYDYIGALGLAIDLCEVYRNEIDDYIGIFNYVIFPTIFDVMEDRSKPHKKLVYMQRGKYSSFYRTRKFAEGISNASKVLKVELNSSFLAYQYGLLRNFYSTLWSTEQKKILQVMHFDYKSMFLLPCISETAWIIYFNATLHYKSYDKLYIYASHLASILGGYSFEEYLNGIMKETVIKVDDYWRNCTSMECKLVDEIECNDLHVVPMLNRLLRASNITLNILCNSNTHYLPKEILSVLRPTLKKLMLQIDTHFEAINNPHLVTLLEVAEKDIAEIFGDSSSPEEKETIVNDYQTFIQGLLDTASKNTQ